MKVESSLMISRDWTALNEKNAKYNRMLKRRDKILKNLRGYRRQIDLLETLICACEVGDKSQIRVLDVACGTGFQMLELASRGYNVTGLETDLNLCLLLKEAAALFDLSILIQLGDACAIPFSAERFDVVMSKNFFEHVYDADLAISEQVRVLKPGGHLIIIDGNFLYPKTLFDLLVLYPIRTKGRHGGLKWLLNKHRVQENLYGYLPFGKDEDVKTPGWWSRYILKKRSLNLVSSTTTGAIQYGSMIPSFLHDFMGGCIVVAKNTGNTGSVDTGDEH